MRGLAGTLLTTLLLAGCASTQSTAPGPATTAPAASVVAPVESASSTLPPDPTPNTVVAGQPQTIHVLENPLGWSEVKVGSLSACSGTCLGDYVVGRSAMLDAETHKAVGSLVTECFLVDTVTGRYHCPATSIALIGRGEIVFTEDVLLGPHLCTSCYTPEPSGYVVDFPVIGATGEFLGATGHVTSPADSTWRYGDFVITLTK